MSEFLTIDSGIGDGVDVELEVKRSRFLTRLRRVDSEETARAVIEERRSTLFDARHHCSAFVLGPEARTTRSSDDGEPAGTAGVPMLNVLTSTHLTDVVAVVTRYFGGVKLGAGGLVRAYSEAVAQAVAQAGTRRVELCSLLGIDVDLASIGAIEDSLRSSTLPSGTAIAVVGVDWGTNARITVAVPVTAAGEFDAFLSAISAGTLTTVPAGQRWVDRPG
ncbi:IMPACT family protein [[Pseudopropionibacterium] massiliense]|uniref:IMPACT family protein n=1 Tax=[Pseudopropionibacterium] massiliense TaxID=2220000 RepID=UPI001A922529|nr:YigZ family protein [[Pseudopropionibacterium] massiliense]